MSDSVCELQLKVRPDYVNSMGNLVIAVSIAVWTRVN